MNGPTVHTNEIFLKFFSTVEARTGEQSSEPLGKMTYDRCATVLHHKFPLSVPIRRELFAKFKFSRRPVPGGKTGCAYSKAEQIPAASVYVMIRYVIERFD